MAEDSGDGGRKRPRYFYGWNVVAASFMAHLAYAEQFSSTLGLFFRPFNAEFGWGRTQIALVQTIARVAEALIAPLVGPLVDRYGARVLMPIGAIIAGFMLIGVTYVDALWQFYLVRGLLAAIGFTLMGSLVTSVAINNWFVRMRGRALAISNTGASISNVIFMPLAVLVIAEFGWRWMFILFAVVTWVVVLVPAATLMRRRPEDMGLLPDGMEPDEAAESDAAGPSETDGGASTGQSHEGGSVATGVPARREAVWSRGDALRTPAFWLIAGSFAIASLAFQGINISLAPYVQDLGFGDGVVAGALTTRAVVMALTLPLMGLIAERAHLASVRVLPFVLQAVGSLLFLFGGNVILLFAALIVYGMGITSLGVTQEVLWANAFGRFSLGTVRSLGFVVTFGFGATGPLFMNGVFDVLGSYRPAFVLFLVLFTIAGILITFLRPPVPRQFAEPSDVAAAPPTNGGVHLA